MNGVGERETRRTGLDGAKSARGRERERDRQTDRQTERPDQDMQQSLAAALFFTIAFIP